MTRTPALAFALAALTALPAAAQEKVDWAAVGRIRDEGFRRSQVMETAAQLTDVHGPRLTGSPQYKKAAEWARRQLETWGLSSAHLESWPFDRGGWSLERCSAHVVSPLSFPLVALPTAWTAGTNGPVRGKVMRVKAETEADVEALKGKIAGMVLWVGQARDLKSPEDGGVFKRYTDQELDDLERYQIPGPRTGRGPQPFDREAFLRRRRVQQALDKLYAAEKPLAVVQPSERDANVLRLGGARYKKGDPQPVTQLVVSATQWGRVARLLDRKMEVEVEIDVKATFHDEPNGYNVVAELPGTDKKGELVMLGAHLDSWHPGTGATDDAAGSAVMMEALRILKAIDAKPRRTVRIGLWGGEEQGFLGSRAYVSEHFASRPEPPAPAGGGDDVPSFRRNEPPAPMTLKPDYSKLSAYFNYDNGTGKIRGIYLQENAATKPIFEAWMEAVKDLGADRVTMRTTVGTDHVPFDQVGLPGFQFIQDPIEYSESFFGTHHTDMDTYDRLQREDLMQAAVVIATFAYQAATRDELLPRKPQPPTAPPPAPPVKPGAKGGAKPAPRAVEAAPGSAR